MPLPSLGRMPLPLPSFARVCSLWPVLTFFDTRYAVAVETLGAVAAVAGGPVDACAV